ncbi:MAG: FHA domain-containing protein [Halobacteriales archaeon]|nr:FHA domain-containing protein [Halobacteriales archaeon]
MAPEHDTDEASLTSLAAQLDALASAPRLALLHSLRVPRELHDIRIPAQGSGRPLSRQTVTHHLEQLEELGLVVRLGPAGGHGDQFLLHHARLFGVIDGLRRLARIRPISREAVTDGTMPGPLPEDPPLPPPPRLAVAYGREDGAGFSLAGRVGTRWRLGRAQPCEIRLDHDPYASAANSVIERAAEGFVLADLPGNRNGTWLNWERLAAGESVPLASGDVVTVGRTHLVFKG